MSAHIHQLCPRCGSAFIRASGGVCARCLLETALSEPDAALLPSPSEEIQIDGDSSLGRVSRYELLEEIAHGGMGIVYRARDTALNRVVALKLMLAGQFAGAREVKRFRAEAEAAARLDHPNIVPIYEVGEQDGRPFFSMKFMDGGTLTERLSTGGSPIDLRQAAVLLAKIARAVHHAHQRAVLHRDLKPGNILLDQQGEPHVSDFGLAKCLDSTDGFTMTGAMLGSPSYMSPEQAAGHADQLTTASDIYSLGALFYQLLTGRPPFEAATPLATLEKVVRQEPRLPRTLRPGLDPDLETICLKCLEKEPARRFGSAEALAEDLERWLRHEPILARPAGALDRITKWTQRNPGTAALVTLSSLAVLGLLVGQTIMSLRLSRANTKAQATNERLARSVYESRWRQADDAARADERGEAIARFSKFLRENPSDSTAAARLLSLLSTCNFPVLLVPPMLHETTVVALDFNRTGDRLATASSGGVARLWNVESGKLEVELKHPAELTHCVLCGQGDLRLLTLTKDAKARLWDLGNKQLILEAESAPLDKVQWSRHVVPTRDHGRIALKLDARVLGVLDANSGAWLKPLLRMPTEISLYAMSADGRLLAIASSSQLQLYKVGSDQPLFAPVALSATPDDLQFSDDAHWLACLSHDKIRLMNTLTGVSEPDFNTKAVQIAFLGKSDRLIISSAYSGSPLEVIDPHTGRECGSPFGQPEFDAQSHGPLLFSYKNTGPALPSRLALLDPANGRFQTELFIHGGPISAEKFSPNGRIVATASQDRTVRLWSVQMRPAEPLNLPVGSEVYEAQWSPAGDRILSSSGISSGQVRLWDARTGATLQLLANLDGVIFWAQWAPDGKRFATAAVNGTARIWDAQTGQPVSGSLRHESSLEHCAFSPGGEWLATAADDHTVRLWDGHSGKPIGEPLLHPNAPLKISFSSDGHRLATGCIDGSICVWSVPDGRLVVGPLHHGGICWVAAFSPDDHRLVSASSDSTAQIWDAATGQPLLPPFRHEGPVLWASFSPDGRAIATSTEFGTTRVWDSATGQLLSAPVRQPGKVWYVKWSSDGRFLVTTCTDGSARLWDAFTGHLVAEPLSHTAELRRADFSPDGQRLLTTGYDGTIKIWDLTLLRPPLPVPVWLSDLAESLVGKRIGPKDSVESVPGNSFDLIKTRIQQVNQNDYYARWAHWLLHERFEQPVKPFQP
ncbi:MAG TPA: protein kinase [Candidatus Limnocylindrales bacterium]|jgi:WD40 repeat protein|nr:protein kinase [Candidatus Limnocylindrales bacterium]